MNPRPLSFRQIHLDFHTSPFIPGVGEAFDPDDFAASIAAAKVESVTLFAKCHHGHLYYDTKHPAKHPTLRRDLLREQIEALRAKNIRTPIYLSVQCDEFAANQHPEWLAVNPDGTRVGRSPLSAEDFGWQVLDMSSPYLDYLCEQTAEIMEKFQPVDGLFFDMCWDQPSVSCWAKSGMSEQDLSPEEMLDRLEYAHRVTLHYIERLTALIAEYQANVPVWFNSRPLVHLKKEKRFLQHIEIEALPTGQWGYGYFPLHVRVVKPLGLPLLGMTGRFHKSWADFGGLRTAASLLYDCAQALAHGAGCSIGDQLHPSGRMDAGVYKVIGQVYDYVQISEPWVRNTEAPKEIAVIYPARSDLPAVDLVHQGIVKALNQLRYQFVFLTSDDPWEDYKLVIIPETIEIDPKLETRIASYLTAGGKVLGEDLRSEPSPFSCTYLRFDQSKLGSLEPIDHVFYDRGVRLTPQRGDEVLAWIVEPYFERTWRHFSSHAQTPARLEPSPYAAAIIRGNQAIFALPVFGAYARHANLPARQLIAAALSALLPDPLLRLKAPSYVEAVIADQNKRRIVHILSYLPQKRTASMEMVEESIPARNLVLDLATPFPVHQVSLQPQNVEIPFQQTGSRTLVNLDWVEGHQIIAVG